MQAYINQIQTFLYVVDFNSFTKAADYLNISRSMVSIHIKTLEKKLGASLLLRNTRNIALTEAGLNLYNDFKDIFIHIDHALERAQQQHGNLSGAFRITSTNEFGRHFILPLVKAFCNRYPNIDLHYYFDSSLNDLISDKLDVAIRLGTLKDSNLKSRKLKEYEILLVATPQLIKEQGIVTLQDLNRVPWIANSNLDASHWQLTNKAQEKVTLTPPQGKYSSNAASAIREMTLASLGVSICPDWLVADDIAAGELQILFPEYRLATQAVYAVFPNNSYMPTKTRVFVDYLVAELAD